MWLLLCFNIKEFETYYGLNILNYRHFETVYKQFGPFTKSAEILRQVTYVQNFVKIDPTILSQLRTRTHTNSQTPSQTKSFSLFLSKIMSLTSLTHPIIYDPYYFYSYRKQKF